MRCLASSRRQSGQGGKVFSERAYRRGQNIIATAKANGTYLKAPNGADTNLTPEQWVQVHTKAFKQWFGDWEKMAHYYVCGLNIGGTLHTVKFVITEFASGEKYYDHSLTEIEKGELLNRAELSSTVADSKTPLPDVKDRRLVLILQIKSSKIVDANGEPKVVYHQTNANVYINRETGQNWDELDGYPQTCIKRGL